FETPTKSMRLSIEKIRLSLSFAQFQRLLLLLTGLAALLFLIQASRYLPVRSDNEYPEAANMIVVQRWARGFPLYTDFRLAPYLLTGFPPLWYGILAMAAKAGFSHVDTLTMIGRILSIGCLLIILALTYRWNYRQGYGRVPAFLAVTLYLS